MWEFNSEVKIEKIIPFVKDLVKCSADYMTVTINGKEYKLDDSDRFDFGRKLFRFKGDTITPEQMEDMLK